MYKKRTLEAVINAANTSFPVLLITGPRQVGKTTLFEHCLGTGRTYVSLDDPQVLSLAKTDPALFFQRFQGNLLIDEVQSAPELFPYIKRIVDKQKQKGMFWLTGSQQFQLMHSVSESLAGRVAVLQLQGFSYAERLGFWQRPAFSPTNAFQGGNYFAAGLQDIYKYIWQGSYPALYAVQPPQVGLFYASYVKTYIERDVRDFLRVNDEQKFLKFVKIAASRTGQLINYADMARDVEVSLNTLRAWLAVLQASGLIYLLPPYSNNISQRLIKTPKLYFMDTGLCCYLTGWLTPETLEAGAMSGALLETFVISEIIKSYWHNGQEPAIYFYRDKDQKEIDILLEQDGKLYPIEVKKTASPSPADIRHFSVLQKFGKKVAAGAVLCFINDTLPLNASVSALPVSFV